MRNFAPSNIRNWRDVQNLHQLSLKQQSLVVASVQVARNWSIASRYCDVYGESKTCEAFIFRSQCFVERYPARAHASTKHHRHCSSSHPTTSATHAHIRLRQQRRHSRHTEDVHANSRKRPISSSNLREVWNFLSTIFHTNIISNIMVVLN